MYGITYGISTTVSGVAQSGTDSESVSDFRGDLAKRSQKCSSTCPRFLGPEMGDFSIYEKFELGFSVSDFRDLKPIFSAFRAKPILRAFQIHFSGFSSFLTN